jgi:di- and tripeptidase
VRIWSTSTLSILYVIIPHLDTDSGDIYSLTYSPTLSTVYFGCQNTSIQWLDLSDISTTRANKAHPESTSAPGTPGKRFHKFFDSMPQSSRNPIAPLTRPPSRHSVNDVNIFSTIGQRELHVPPENVILSAHYGYVYCMALSPSHLCGGDTPSNEEIYLLTGSGDEEVKVSPSSFNPSRSSHYLVDVARDQRRTNRKAHFFRLRRWCIVYRCAKRDHLRRVPRRASTTFYI